MIKSLLKGFAFAVGTGIVVGFGMKVSRQHAIDPTEVSEFSPTNRALLDRVATLEHRLARAERACRSLLQEGGSAGDMAAKLTTLENQLESRSLELQELRAHLELIEDRHLQTLNALTRNTDGIQEHLTGLIEQTVGATVESIRVRLQADIQETYSRTGNSIVETICDSVRQRLSAFETALAVNSEAMTQLCADSMTSQKAIESLLKKIEVPASRSTPDFPPMPNWISKREQSLGPLRIAPARVRVPIWARQKAG